jgi:PAS domain S-box-containing protein
MNEKIGFLKLFFQPEKDLLPAALAGKISDQFPDFVLIYDAETHLIRYINEKFRLFAGGNDQDLSESPDILRNIVHPDDVTEVDGFLNGVSEPCIKNSLQSLVRLYDQMGQLHFYSFTKTALQKNDEESPGLILLTAHDSTQALKSKDEIDTTRELLDETEELLQFGSWALEINSQTVTWTSGLYSLLGYTRDELAGNVDLDFYLSHVLEEYYQPLHESIQRALNEKEDFELEYTLRTKTGALKNISTKGKIVKGEDGKVIKLLCINRDITSLRSFEKEQERNIRELNRSNKELEEFAYIASHDLQEPLRKISMFTERLKAKYANTLDKEGELFIERVLLSAGNMRTLIDNLLEFSRANRRSHTYDLVNLRTLLDVVISELELKIEETKSTIEFTGSFPNVEAVPSEMTQLFSNILSNAIKFRKNGVPAKVQVLGSRLSKAEKNLMNLQPNVNFYKIEIQDNGIGFEPEYSEKIFQIFQRLNGKAEYPGSGIGLAICKKIVEKHNGLIFAKSQIDQGANFTVILPEKQF